eukprot:gene5164-10325_t
MDLLYRPPSLEGGLYRRDRDSILKWTFNVHSVAGPYFRFVQHPLCAFHDPNSLGSYTARSKLSQLRLHSGSELKSIKGPENPSLPKQFSYFLQVNGIDDDGKNITWTVAMSSEKQHELWLNILNQAKDSAEAEESSGDLLKLYQFAQKMKANIEIRDYHHRFKKYSKCFYINTATRWISNELSCSQSIAIDIANRMVNSGLIHHIHFEYIVSDSHLLFRFSNSTTKFSTLQNLSMNDFSTTSTIASSNHDPVQDSTKEMQWLDKKRLQKLNSTRTALGALQINYDGVSDMIEKQKEMIIKLQYSVQDLSRLCLLLIVINTCLLFREWAYQYYNIIWYLFICIMSILLIATSTYLVHTTYTPLQTTNILLNHNKKTSATSTTMNPTLNSMVSMDEANNVDIDLMSDVSSIEDGESDIGTTIGMDTDIDTTSATDVDVDGISEELSTLPPPEIWPNRPILIRRTEAEKEEERRKDELLQPLCIHCPDTERSELSIDTDLFVGKAHIMIADLPDAPVEYFRKRQRRFVSTVQGQFKRPMSFASVYTGHAFTTPLENLPPKWLLNAALQMVYAIQPGLQVNLEGSEPYAVSPLISTSKTIVVSRVGEEPSFSFASSNNLEEDSRLLGKPFDSNMSAKNRQTFFRNRENLLKFTFDPSLVYTFEFYQHVLNLGSFQLDIGFMKFDILKALGMNPVQVMALEWDSSVSTTLPKQPKYLYNFEIWHERSLSSAVLRKINKKLKKHRVALNSVHSHTHNQNYNNNYSQKDTATVVATNSEKGRGVCNDVVDRTLTNNNNNNNNNNNVANHNGVIDTISTSSSTPSPHRHFSSVSNETTSSSKRNGRFSVKESLFLSNN